MLYKAFTDYKDETSLLCSFLESTTREHYYFYEGKKCLYSVESVLRNFYIKRHSAGR